MRRLSSFGRLYPAATAAFSTLNESLIGSGSTIRVAITQLARADVSSLTLDRTQGRHGLLINMPSRLFSSYPPYTELAMPSLSPTMSQGNLIGWKVQEGQQVAAGDILAEVETDKATLDWENQDDGYVARLLVPAGTKDIAVGSPVAILVEDEDQIAAFKDFKPTSGGAASQTSAPSESSSEQSHAAAAQSSGATYQVDERIGPAARMLLHEAGLAASSIKPTGPHGIVTKGDVLAAIASGVKPSSTPTVETTSKPTPAPTEQPAAAKSQPAAPKPAPPAAAPTPSASYVDIPVTQIRRIIAERLLESKSTIPHLYVSADICMDGVTAMRESLKQQGSKISVNDFVIKAVAMALRDVPAANSMWNTSSESIQPLSSVDISIAVATDAGLITPIVKNADTKTLSQISAEVRDLAGRARANKLKPEEFQGGSFSISNLGMYGVDSFYAIINPPQACIMAVGTGRKEVALQAKSPVVTAAMTVTLSADHRVFDGSVASDLLEAFKEYMQSPFRLLGGV